MTEDYKGLVRRGRRVASCQWERKSRVKPMNEAEKEVTEIIEMDVSGMANIPQLQSYVNKGWKLKGFYLPDKEKGVLQGPMWGLWDVYVYFKNLLAGPTADVKELQSEKAALENKIREYERKLSEDNKGKSAK